MSKTIHPAPLGIVPAELLLQDSGAFYTAIEKSLSSVGAVIIQNGISREVPDALERTARHFFTQIPEATKRMLFDPLKRGERGYVPLDSERIVDAKHHEHRASFRWGTLEHKTETHYPTNPTMDRVFSTSKQRNTFITAYNTAFDDYYSTATSMLSIIAELLGKTTSYYSEKISSGNNVLSSQWYPPNNSVVAQKHFDKGYLALSFETPTGLEYYHDRVWHAVPHVPNGLLITLGQALSKETGFPAFCHRVVGTRTSRLVSVFFANPVQSEFFTQKNLTSSVMPATVMPASLTPSTIMPAALSTSVMPAILSPVI